MTVGLPPVLSKEYYSWCRNDLERAQLRYILDNTEMIPRRDIKGIIERTDADSRNPDRRILWCSYNPRTKDIAEGLWSVEVLHGEQYVTWTRHEHGDDYETMRDLLTPRSAAGSFTYIPHLSGTLYRYITALVRRVFIPNGYIYNPLGSRTEKTGFELKHNGRTWTFQDLTYAMWITPTEDEPNLHIRGRRMFLGRDVLATYLARVQRINQACHDDCGIWSQATPARTATGMLKRTFPKRREMWLPPDRLRTMLDLCWGSRGGYQYGTRYSGHMSKIDRRRAYMSEMMKPLPHRWAISEAFVDGEEQPGIYVCRLRGTSPIPLGVGAWSESQGMYVPVQFTEGEIYTVLPSSEFEGYRALGIEIEPRFGYRVIEWITLEEFTGRLAAILVKYDGDNDVLTYMKSLPNTLIGSFARQSRVRHYQWNAEYPGDGWFESLDTTGEVIENEWYKDVRTWSHKMHLDKAAWIYGANKSAMFQMVAFLVERGHTILYFHTDGIIYSGYCPEAAMVNEKRPGYFKDEGTDENGDVYRAGWYEAFGMRRKSGQTLQIAIEDRHYRNLDHLEDLYRRKSAVVWNIGDVLTPSDDMAHTASIDRVAMIE